MNIAERLNALTPGARGARLGDHLTFAESGGGLIGIAGRRLFVNSVTGNDNTQDGLSIYEPKKTIQAAVDLAQDYSTIFIDGRFDEDVVGPAWASGAGAENVTIRGMSGGSGWYPNAPEWRSSNNTTGIPLILRSVGWSIEGIKFRVPTTNVAVKLRYRVNDSDVYDAVSPNLAACCRIKKCWFYGGGTGLTGINLLGAPYCTLIEGNYFELIVNASGGKCITCTESSMASPFRTFIIGNIFNEVEGMIDFNAKGTNASIIAGNILQGTAHGGYSGHWKCSLGPGNDNTVVGNYFGGDFSLTGGYKAGSGDMWIGGNWAEDIAETEVDTTTGLVIAVPT